MFHHVDAFSAAECVYALTRRRHRKSAPPVTYIRPGQARLRALARR